MDFLFTGPGRDKVVDLYAKVIQKELAAELVDIDKVIRKELKRFKLPAADLADDVVGGFLGAVTGLVAAPVASIAAAGLDTAQVKPMARTAAAELVPRMPAILDGTYDYLDSVLDIESTLGEKMVAMTAEQFEDVLRPAFHADEKTLIAVGAVLGFLVGELQVVFVEHLSR